MAGENSSSNLTSNFETAAAVAAPVLKGSANLLANWQNYKYQKRLMKLQNQYNIDMWKMQADYNSPQAQMQRFQDAGLNPNLIYGQGSNGNMSSAPVQEVPDAPRYDKAAEELANAFNLINLRKAIADTKHAEADARSAKEDADLKQAENEADKAIGLNFYYDIVSGTYKPFDTSKTLFEGKSNPLGAGRVFRKLLDAGARSYLLNDRKNFLRSQNAALQPQIWMSNYDKRYYPATFWIGNGTRVFNSLNPFKFFK